MYPGMFSVALWPNSFRSYDWS